MAAAWAVALVALAPTAHAQGLAACALLDDDTQRLRCYDQLAGRVVAAPTGAAAPTKPLMEPQTAAAPESALGHRWGLDQGARLNAFTIQPHRQNFLMPLAYTNAVNTAPYQPTLDALANAGLIQQTTLPLDATEARFQLSLKVKLWQDLVPGRADLWMGYTQQSTWQVYNRDVSSPFRNTDYTPEAMLAWRTDVDLGSWRWRLLTLGLVHQSNGQSKPLSRSWNRVYAEFGLERGPLTVTVRPWHRIRESAAKDDNPDIQDYIGRGDLVATYSLRGHQFGALVRHSFASGRGATQLDWSFPLAGPLRGYVQLFNGYGQNLLDYKHRQTSGGVGFLLTDRL